MTVQREHLLVVDDDEAGRYLKARLLSKAGYEVSEVATGNEARTLIAKRDYALILLDVKLPDVNGLDLCREIKSAKPDTLILQTSAAFTGQQDRAKGLAGGADSYLIEPLDPQEFQATVEALMRRYRNEQGLRERHDTLEQVLVERGEQIAQIDARLRTEIDHRADAEDMLRHAQKLDVLGQLTGGIAHDFNNVLTIVMGNLESVRRQLERPQPDLARLRSHTESAFYGAQRAIGITRQLLAFARRQALAPRVIIMNAFVRNLALLLKQIMGEKIEVSLDLADDLWPVMCDTDQMETMILNLAINARDAMPEGGSLTIATKNISSTHATLTVKDTGAGMSAEVLAYAFEPFFTTKDVGHGTGLGLSQVHGFMRQSGGEVKISSTLGEGTSVQLLFPRYIGDVAAVGPAHEDTDATRKPLRKATILAVEDDTLVRQHTTGILREMGLTVLEAANGREALHLLQQHPEIEVILSDVGLAGGLSGPELGREAARIRPDAKVLYTTGYAPAKLADEGITASDNVIVKPFTFNALASRLADILGPGDTPGKSGAILLVEDEPMIRMDTAMTLRDLGFEVVEAGSISDAVKEMATLGDGVGAIIVDLGLPDGRGDQLVERLRAERAELPVIFTTGYSEPALHAKFGADKNAAFVPKPYYADQLAEALSRFDIRPPN